MEIHIDTRRDSDEEIRKTIRFLQSLIGDESNTPASNIRPATEGSFNMFGDDAPAAAPMNMFGSDDDAPSDYSPNKSDDDDDGDSIIEIVEY